MPSKILRATVLPVRGHTPEMHPTVFLAPNATVVGEVKIGRRCSLWFNAVIRGDVNSIEIGEDTNIQDGAIVHCTYQTAATVIGSRVSVGHGAILHGCTLADDILIGMGAKVLDNARIEPEVLVAAGALVPPGKVLESGYLYAGLPARKIRPLSAEERKTIRQTAENYKMYAQWYT